MTPAAPPAPGAPSASGGAARPSGRWGWIALAFPLALAAAAYARTLGGPLVFDDVGAIADNTAIKDLGRFISERLLPMTLAGDRSLTNLTFAVNYAVGRLEPWNYHLTNVAIHFAVVVLVFAFTARTASLAGVVRERPLALAVAGTFALHPIQTEAVSYVVQRAESLASGLYLAVLLLLLAAERLWATRRGAVAWAAAVVAFAAGLAAKTIVLTAPAAHLLVAAVVAGTPAASRELVSWRRRLLLVAPLLALGAAQAAATVAGLSGSTGAGFGLQGLPPSAYLATQARVLPVYLRLLAWPTGQNVTWDFPVSQGLRDPGVASSAALLLGLGLGALALARWARARADADGAAARLAALGVAWFFLVLSVTSSVVPLVDVLVEHRLYLASWGVFVAVWASAGRACARLGDRGGWGAAAVVAAVWCALAVVTHQRNAVWESSEALWRDAVGKSPGKAVTYLSLGEELRRQRRYAEAIPVLVAGVERAEGGSNLELRLLNNLGVAYSFEGRIAEAASMFRFALAKAPGDSMLLGNLASAFLTLGDLDGAEQLALRAIAADPSIAKARSTANAWGTVAAARLGRGDPGGALEATRRALEIHPDLGIAFYNRGRALAALGRAQEACAAWREAVSLPLNDWARSQAEGRLASRCSPGDPATYQGAGR